jgi:cyclophilin family peptidyl-prolyl cis-trans isomerase
MSPFIETEHLLAFSEMSQPHFFFFLSFILLFAPLNVSSDLPFFILTTSKHLQEDFEMVFGLYGQAAPQITENFLRYCASPTADSASVTTASGGAASSSSSSSWGKPDLNLPSRNGATGSELSQEDDQGVVQPRLDKGQLWRLEPGVLLEGGKIKGLKEVRYELAPQCCYYCNCY